MVSLRLSQRDLKVLTKCAAGKCLSTGQVARLCFPNVTLDAVRKSLRRLAEAGYLASHREHQMAEALHTVGPKGKTALEARGVSTDAARQVPRQFEHLLGVNEIRLAFEVSTLPVAYFFASWELQGFGWVHPVIPDAVVGLRLPERRTIFVEYDRGTETLATLIKKLRSYEDGFSGVQFRALLVCADADARLDTLARQVRKEGFLRRMLGCVISDLASVSAMTPLFRDLRTIGSHKLSFDEIAR